MDIPSVMIDWESGESTILFNPFYSEEDKLRLQKILEATSDWPGHLWLATSGSTAAKWVGLAKPAVLSSAFAVNEHLASTEKDRWIHPLPDFHVGGLGIWARSYLSGAQVFNYKEENPGKWDPQLFYDYLLQKEGTLTSLVPAQLYDLLHLELRAPPSLRAVVIGGGRLVPDLYFKAVKLGWKVLPSYGMTECASQIATAELGSWNEKEMPKLKVLSHLQVKQAEVRLCFAGQSVMSLYAVDEGSSIRLFDPKKEGWFVSEDLGECKEGFLTVFGRADSLIKIGGENVDMDYMETILQTLLIQSDIKQEMTLIAVPDERLGFVIHLAAVDCPASLLQSIVDQFQKKVLPFEKIRVTHTIPYMPKSPLSKILKKDLLNLIRKY